MFDQLKLTERFENDGDKNRLIIELDGSTTVIDFQVDMIRNNRIPGLLQLDMRRVDSRIMLYYDVTGKWMLRDMLDHKEFSGSEFLSLLEKFIQALTGSEAYLLDTTQFALDEEHIFLEGDMEPRLLYLPVKTVQNVHESFKNLLLQMIVYRARVKDQDSGPVLSGILNYMKRDSFNLYEFQKALRTMNSVGSLPCIQTAANQESIIKSAEPVSLAELIPKENRGSGIVDRKMPEAPILQPVREYTSKAKLKTSVLLAVLVFQIVLAAGVLFGFGPVYEATEDLTTAYAAMGLMAVCLDGLVLKNLLKPENRITVQVPAKKQGRARRQANKDHNDPFRIDQTAKGASAPSINYHKKVICSAPSTEHQANIFDTEVLTPAGVPGGVNDTVVLSALQAAPYLVRKGPFQEIIRLKRQALVLGRQADLSGHVIDDPAIGRMHAELTWMGDLCQIRDLNSKNGTFVNGMRITGPQPINIFPGDEIRLGSLEYTLAQD